MTREELVQYAVEYTSFYAEKYAGANLQDGKSLPILTKEEAAHAGVSIISREYYTKLGTPEVKSAYTSGSTGISLEAFSTDAESAGQLFSLWLYRRKYYGINTDAKFCFFFTLRDHYGKTKYDEQKNYLGISKELLHREKLDEIFGRIYAFQPKWLLLQPSIAMILARYIYETGAEVPGSLTYIELSGEMVTDRQRRFIESAFGAVTASQYGCNEIGTIAYECPEGNLHVMDHNVYVEIEPFTEQERAAGTGHVIVTARHNKVMPFIRYDIGDIAGWKDVSCTCGCHGAVLELTGARKDDMIRLQDGQRISANLFRRAIQAVECCMEGRIYQYQVRQTAVDTFEIFMATDGEPEEIEGLFCEFIRDSLVGEAAFLFRYYEQLLPDELTGKLKFFLVHDTGADRGCRKRCRSITQTSHISNSNNHILLIMSKYTMYFAATT